MGIAAMGYKLKQVSEPFLLIFLQIHQWTENNMKHSEIPCDVQFIKKKKKSSSSLAL